MPLRLESHLEGMKDGVWKQKAENREKNLIDFHRKEDHQQVLIYILRDYALEIPMKINLFSKLSSIILVGHSDKVSIL